ncbi:SRPBCC domain-containing protein [Nonomuraea sp. NPDC050786]|uniref:SRPBCC domain-containing protein n=1 Tax=Nonomuraea sp. NPDC050786 TaxID=3154840 RepID=UPI0033D71D61
MRHISTSIEIHATPDQVWDVLVDFAGYKTWNPFIQEGSGQATVGSTLTLRMHPEDGKPMTFRPKVLAAEAGSRLRWIGHFIVPGLFDGTHEFVLTATNGGTRLVQSETFKGILVPFLGKMIAGTERNFARLNEALKRHVESSRV